MSEADDVREAASRRAHGLERIRQAELQAKRQRRAEMGDAASDSEDSDDERNADAKKHGDSDDSGALRACVCQASVCLCLVLLCIVLRVYVVYMHT